jgi:hypothetical protein
MNEGKLAQLISRKTTGDGNAHDSIASLKSNVVYGLPSFFFFYIAYATYFLYLVQYLGIYLGAGNFNMYNGSI